MKESTFYKLRDNKVWGFLAPRVVPALNVFEEHVEAFEYNISTEPLHMKIWQRTMFWYGAIGQLFAMVYLWIVVPWKLIKRLMRPLVLR